MESITRNKKGKHLNIYSVLGVMSEDHTSHMILCKSGIEYHIPVVSNELIRDQSLFGWRMVQQAPRNQEEFRKAIVYARVKGAQERLQCSYASELSTRVGDVFR